MKREEWGLLTVAGLLAGFVFPPYFLHVLAISGLTAVGYLMTPSDGDPALRRLIEFEQEFRVGHDFEEQREWERAIEVYRALARKYRGHPTIQSIALQRVKFVEERQQGVGR